MFPFIIISDENWIYFTYYDAEFDVLCEHKRSVKP